MHRLDIGPTRGRLRAIVLLVPLVLLTATTARADLKDVRLTAPATLVAQEGTLPTARQLHKQVLLAGSDPYSMYKTLDRGYEQMLPQVWMSPQQKYDVIHYIRESILKEHNPDQYFEVTPDYLASLPRGRSTRLARA